MKLQIQKTVDLFYEIETNTKILTDIDIDLSKCCVLAIDLYAIHKCLIAQEKINLKIPKINSFLKKIRNNGGKIIYGCNISSNKYDSLKNNISKIPVVDIYNYGTNIQPLKYQVSNGGIVKKNKNFNRHNLEIHPDIEIDYENDVLSNHGKEIVNYIKYMNIEHIFIIGFHLNLCILDKQYGVQNIIRYKLPVILVRDLTDILFAKILEKNNHTHNNYLKKNNYTHNSYLEYVISYFEKYYGPSTLSINFK